MRESWVGTIIVFFVILFVYTKLAGPIPFSINSINTTKTDLFSSTGEGKINAVPDQATVMAGITGQSQTVADAKNKINLTSDKIIKDLKKLGLSDKDIKTTDYSVNPNYSNNSGTGIILMMAPGGQQNITGYTVTQNLNINVQPIDKANQVIDTVTNDGANLVGGVNFTFSDQLSKSLETQATQLAVNDAKTKAEALAKAAGISLGKIVNVVRNQGGQIMPMMAAGINSKADQSIPTNVTPGQNSLTVDVVLYYETY
jgi:uncharacterized protein YggE